MTPHLKVKARGRKGHGIPTPEPRGQIWPQGREDHGRGRETAGEGVGLLGLGGPSSAAETTWCIGIPVDGGLDATTTDRALLHECKMTSSIWTGEGSSEQRFGWR